MESKLNYPLTWDEKLVKLMLITDVTSKKDLKNVRSIYSRLISYKDERIDSLIDAFLLMSQKDKDISILFIDPTDKILNVSNTNKNIRGKLSYNGSHSTIVIKPKTDSAEKLRMSNAERSILHEISHYVYNKLNEKNRDKNSIEKQLNFSTQKTFKKNLVFSRAFKSAVFNKNEKHRAISFTFNKTMNIIKSYKPEDRAEELLCETFGIWQYANKHSQRRDYIEKYFGEMLNFIDNFFIKSIQKYISENIPDYSIEKANNSCINKNKLSILEKLKRLDLREVLSFHDDLENITKQITTKDIEAKDFKLLGTLLNQKLGFPLQVGVYALNAKDVSKFSRAVFNNNGITKSSLSDIDFIDMKSHDFAKVNSKKIDLCIYIYNSQNNSSSQELCSLKEYFSNNLFVIDIGLDAYTSKDENGNGILDEQELDNHLTRLSNDLQEYGIKEEDIFVIGSGDGKNTNTKTQRDFLGNLFDMLCYSGESARIERFNQYLELFSDIYNSGIDNSKLHAKFDNKKSHLNKMDMEQIKSFLDPKIKNPMNKDCLSVFNKEISIPQLDTLSQYEQWSQILNLSSNYSDDKNYLINMIGHLSNIFKNLTDNDFKKSIYDSMESIKTPNILSEKIKSLENNKVNSFLLTIAFSWDHSIPVIFRKVENKISATIVNKTFKDIGGQYIEFLFNDVRTIEKLLSESNSKIRTEDLYMKFFKECTNFCVLGINSKGQKEFNCFLKEPEAAVKFLLSTRDFTIENLIRLRNPEINFHPKWPCETTKTRRMFLDDILQQNNEDQVLKEKLEYTFNIYEMNKNFRRYLKDGARVSYAINNSFPSNCNDIEKTFVSFLTTETIMKYGREIYEHLSCLNNKEILYDFNQIVSITSQNAYVAVDPEYLKKLKNTYTFVARQLREKVANALRQNATEGGIEIKEKLKLIDKSLSIYPKFSEALCLKGDLLLNKQNNHAAIKNYRTASELKPLNEKYKERINFANEIAK